MRMSYAEIREAVATLKNQNAKPLVDNKYVGIIHPYAEYDIFADTNVLASFQYAYPRGPQNPLAKGEIGDFYGVRWVVTTNARVFGSQGASGADVYATMVLGRQAYGVVDYDQIGARVLVKPVGSAGGLDPLDQMGTVGWKAAHACAILNQNFMVRIEHTVGLGTEGV